MVKYFNSETAGGGGQFDALPAVVFRKMCLLKRGVKPWFFVMNIISYIFPENFVEVPQVVQKI